MTSDYIQQMLAQYADTPLSPLDKLREILQQAALLGLARHQFFEHAGFYGGTALRILHSLDRYSEDLDFSLLKSNPQFDFTPYIQGMRREMEAMGFQLEVMMREKNEESGIWSAFLKTNTLTMMLTLEKKSKIKRVNPEQKIQVKIEIDTDPPAHSRLETKLVENPIPFYVVTFPLPDLFAGKMHAALCRRWQHRIKGRDWYDVIWYIKNNVPLNLKYLRDCMVQSNNLGKDEIFGETEFKQRLRKKIEQLDWDLARKDVLTFVTDTKQLEIWSPQFFLDVVQKLRFEM